MKQFAKETDYKERLKAAIQSGDDKEFSEAFAEAINDIKDGVKEETMAAYESAVESNDDAILAQRGFRQLTSREKEWYKNVIEAMKTSEPKQAFLKLVQDDTMPATIIEDVYKDLIKEHPLLQAIHFEYVGYITKWILNTHAKQAAVWGPITDTIKAEITSGFKVINLKQSKLSAYAVVEKGMLDLGPAFLDAYVRKCLKETIFDGLEDAIVSGTGVNQPIGMTKQIQKEVSYSPSTGYPDKVKVKVTSFATKAYCDLVAKMAKTEEGKARTFTEVGLICNQNDYLTKIMPATTVLNNLGVYVNNIFPVPTTVYVVNSLKDGEAVLFLKNKYFLGVGGEKNATIEYSDECNFIEDQRVFKVKQYAAGQMEDNTCSVFLDISKLEPTYITVKNEAAASPAA